MNQKGFIWWIVLLGVLVVAATVVYFNAPNSLPGDLIYPVKTIRENIRLGANELSFKGRADAYIDQTNERFREVVVLIEEKRSDDKITETLERLQIAQKKALENIEKARSKGTNMTIYIGELEESLKRQQPVLQDLRYQVPSSLYDVVNKVMLDTNNNLVEIEQIRTYR